MKKVDGYATPSLSEDGDGGWGERANVSSFSSIQGLGELMRDFLENQIP